MQYDIKDLVHLFYHPRMKRLLDRDFQETLVRWQGELKAENSTALGQILSHYPTVMLVGPAQSGKTSTVSGLLHFEGDGRSQWINKHAGTGAMSKTKVPTRYVQSHTDPDPHVRVQPEMEREIEKVYQAIQKEAGDRLVDDEDPNERHVTQIIMENQEMDIFPQLLRGDSGFSVLDMPGTAAVGSSLEELLSNTKGQRYRIFNLLKERYLLYRVFPDVAQVLVVVNPLDKLGAAKWASQDYLDQCLHRYLPEIFPQPPSLRDIIRKYQDRTILGIPDINYWKRRENWEEEYWQSLQSLREQLAVNNQANVVFLRAPEVEEAYEDLYDKNWADLEQSSYFADCVASQTEGFKDRENRGFPYLAGRVWKCLERAHNVENLRNSIEQSCSGKLKELGFCGHDVKPDISRKLFRPDELEFISARITDENKSQLQAVSITDVDLLGNYKRIYQNLARLSPGPLYQLLQQSHFILEGEYVPARQEAEISHQFAVNFAFYLKEAQINSENLHWQELKREWQKSDFPLHHFSDEDFQKAYLLLTRDSDKKIIYTEEIQSFSADEKASFLAGYRVAPVEGEEEDGPAIAEAALSPVYSFQTLPVDFSTFQFWRDKESENFLILYHNRPPAAFLQPGRYQLLKKKGLLETRELNEVLQEMVPKEMTLGDILQHLKVDLNTHLVLIEHDEKHCLVC